MRQHIKRFLSLTMVAVLLIGSMGITAFAADDNVTITLLATSDIHGMFYSYDYATGSETNNGWARVAAIVKQERANDPDLLLVDNGDTSQANLISEFRNEEYPPVPKALNLVGYETWTPGNHEFNFEFAALEKAISQFEGDTILANAYKPNGDRWLAPYVIKEVKGVKVALIGITAPHVPVWEKTAPEHYNGMTFTDPTEEVGKVLNELGDKADVFIVVGHYGLEGEYGTDGLEVVAETYADKLDAIVVGHAHAEFADVYNFDKGTVAMLEPGQSGAYAGKITIEVNADKEVVNKSAEILSTASVTPDDEFLKEFASLHEASLEISNTVLGTVAEDFLITKDYLPGIPRAVVEDTALMDLINNLQMETVGADVSLAALFDQESNLPAGEFRFKDAVKVYKYDNTLYGIKTNGKELKQIMELYAGDYFNQYKEGDVTIGFNPTTRLYNYDVFQGVGYKIDISKPSGQRIVDLTFKGEPLADDQELTLALNNYRYGALTEAGIIDGSPDKVVYESNEAIRDMIADYVKEKGTISPECDYNWEIVGYDFSDPQAELIYDKMNKGEISTEDGEAGRYINVKAINAIELRAAGVLPALDGEEAPAVTPEPEAPVIVEPPVVTPEPVVVSNNGGYVVVKGDSLWKIASKELGNGNRWSEIYDLNKDQISNPAKIQIGQQLLMPAS